VCQYRVDNVAWVNAVVAQGWKLIPTYVGAQAPCTTFVNRMSDTNATAEGAAAADDAVTHAADCRHRSERAHLLRHRALRR